MIIKLFLFFFTLFCPPNPVSLFLSHSSLFFQGRCLLPSVSENSSRRFFIEGKKNPRVKKDAGRRKAIWGKDISFATSSRFTASSNVPQFEMSFLETGIFPARRYLRIVSRLLQRENRSMEHPPRVRSFARTHRITEMGYLDEIP